MNQPGSGSRIDGGRLLGDFEALALIGSTGDGGVDRPALGEAHLAARDWFRRRIEEEGFEFRTDAAGNHSARLPARDPGARTLLLGSHLDSVPRGGRFDGALGTLAAFEVLRAVRDAGVLLPVHLEAIDFTDEEGTLVGLLGSRALAGSLAAADLAQPRCGADVLREALERAGLDPARVLEARRDPASLAGFLELHIEQGPRLLEAGVDIGIVTDIVGIRSREWIFVGRADHAGTTPLGSRRDAGLGAASCIVESQRLVVDRFPGAVVNFGHLAFEPGATNVVPGRAHLVMECRAPGRDELLALESALLDTARSVADRHGLDFESRAGSALDPSPCAGVVREAFRRAAGRVGCSHVELPSGAGHDTMALARACPAGMIFVPSSCGSHSPREHAEWAACVKGASVLLEAALDIAGMSA